MVHTGGAAAGGMSAISGVNGLEAFAFEAGSRNSLLHWPAGVDASERSPWSNWANNRRTQPAGHCRPATLEELVAIVRSAAREAKPVRAVGSSWSFSDIAVTHGYVVETNRLSRILESVLPARSSTTPAPTRRSRPTSSTWRQGSSSRT